MTRHHSIHETPSQAKNDGQVLWIGSINFNAEKTALEKFLGGNGFNECAFYWPDIDDDNRKNKGWCYVAFDSKEIAEKAQVSLSKLKFQDRWLKTGPVIDLPESLIVAAQESKTTEDFLARIQAGDKKLIADLKEFIAAAENEPQHTKTSEAVMIDHHNDPDSTRAGVSPSSTQPENSARAVIEAFLLAESPKPEDTGESAAGPSIPDSPQVDIFDIALDMMNEISIQGQPPKPADTGESATEPPKPVLDTEEPATWKLGHYPETWNREAEPDTRRLAFFTRYENLQAESPINKLVNRFVLTTDQYGLPKFHSRQYPSPSPCNDQAATKVYIYMVKSSEYKRATLEEIGALESGGWAVWDAPGRPSDPDNPNKDNRVIDRHADKYEVDKPAMDTSALFGHEIRIMESLGYRRDWSTGLNTIMDADLIKQPGPENVARMAAELKDMGFLGDRLELTNEGRFAMIFPLPPIWYNVILAGVKCQCVWDITAVAALSNTQSSIFLRPRFYETVADFSKAQFASPLSDHLTEFNAYVAYQRATKEGIVDMHQWCQNHFLDKNVMDEVTQIRNSIASFIDSKYGKGTLENVAFESEDYHTRIRQALALGLYHNSAIIQKGHDQYKAVHTGQRSLLSPRSGLVNGHHEWIVYNESVASGRPYFVTATAVDPVWFINLPYFNDERLPKKYTKEFKYPEVKKSLDQARERAKA